MTRRVRRVMYELVTASWRCVDVKNTPPILGSCETFAQSAYSSDPFGPRASVQSWYSLTIGKYTRIGECGRM